MYKRQDLELLVNIVDGQMTVCELVDRYLKTKTGVRQSTKQGYVTDKDRKAFATDLKTILKILMPNIIRC